MEYLYCLDSVANLFGSFDTTIAPPLLYYSYIPIIILSLVFGLLVLRGQAKSTLQSWLFFAIASTFSLFLMNEIVQWIAVSTSWVHFGWELAPFLQMTILLLLIYFVIVFVNKKDTRLRYKFLLFLFFLPVLVFLPTKLNMQSFDLLNCQSNIGPLFFYVYALQIASIFFILFFCTYQYRKTQDLTHRKEIMYLMLGSVAFMVLFSASNILGEITKVYSINLFGPIGMLIFLGFLTYMIVKFQAFNVKLFSAQALVWAVVFFIGAQFFFIRNPINYVLNGITFVMTIVFGKYLIASVKREIEQKEYLATLNFELKGLIKQRENLVHLITHKVKGSFTRSKYIFAEMVEGSFGKLDDMMMKMAKKGLDSDNEGIHTVDMVLNSFNLGSGIVKYDMKPMDLKKTVEEVLGEKGSRAKDKGLAVETLAPDPEYKVNGDVFWLKEVVNNFIENSIRYSIKGTIHVTLEKVDGKVKLSVKDNGVGLSDEDKKGLFTEGGRGKDSLKMNVDSTGYGLFSVKVIVEAHGGKVWAESEGRDMGSTFCIELPMIS